MRQGEYKIVNNHYVRKGLHPIFRNRDGYAKSCYFIYECEKAMKEHKPIGHCYTLAEAKELTK